MRPEPLEEFTRRADEHSQRQHGMSAQEYVGRLDQEAGVAFDHEVAERDRLLENRDAELNAVIDPECYGNPFQRFIARMRRVLS